MENDIAVERAVPKYYCHVTSYGESLMHEYIPLSFSKCIYDP